MLKFLRIASERQTVLETGIRGSYSGRVYVAEIAMRWLEVLRLGKHAAQVGSGAYN